PDGRRQSAPPGAGGGGGGGFLPMRESVPPLEALDAVDLARPLAAAHAGAHPQGPGPVLRDVGSRARQADPGRLPQQPVLSGQECEGGLRRPCRCCKFLNMTSLRACLLLLCVAATQDISPADVDAMLKRADGMFEEAKKGYDDARAANSVQGFVEAGFKLEEARFKYLVVQEIGSADNKKAAGDRLRAVQQLGKLIRESRLAISGAPAAPPPSDKPDAPAAKPAVPATAPAKAAADLLVRLPVPDAAVQREAEKSIKDLFKAEYAKKTAADRQALAIALLEQAGKVGDDPGGLWVL